MDISNAVRYVGVNDHQVDLFEGQYPVPNGMAYNSYVILDEKIAVMDTVDAHFVEEWLDNLRAALDGRQPDYLVVQHMEPDHSAGVQRFKEQYPAATVVATAKAFGMMEQFFGQAYADSRRVVTEGDTLPLGSHTLHFVTAPMVHWPEVMVSYEDSEKLLFSADAFGKFGALDREEPWLDEARRYYIGIVGKYGVQVQALLKKAAALDIAAICPLHGPVLTEELGTCLGLYDTWSAYRPEKKGVVVAYASVYGHTRQAALQLADRLREQGTPVEVFDLARCDLAEATAKAFCYDTLVLASVTYNGDVFPPMKNFLLHLTERNYRNRRVALMENGSWAPMAAKVMRTMLEGCKELTFTASTVRILSAPDSAAEEAIRALAQELQ